MVYEINGDEVEYAYRGERWTPRPRSASQLLDDFGYASVTYIGALPRNDPGRGPDLLHVTLISLYDLRYAPPEWLPATIAALDGFAAAPFPLRFDRIENRKAVTLRTRDPLAEARAFQKALVNHLLREKAPIMDGTTPEPHLTINYRGDRQGSETLGKKTPPIGWTVDEIILMESIVGKTTHVEHGRWPLRAGAS